MKPILIGIDRDGTIIENSGDFPGHNWPNETVRLIPDVVQGLKLLKSIKNVTLIMVTNQAGPARGKVTVEQTKQFNLQVNDVLKAKGAGLNGIYSCEHVSPAYAERCRAEGKHIDNRFVKSCPDWKPGIGMFKKAAKSIGKKLSECTVFMIGDRHGDPEAGVNAGGTGIFIETAFEEKHFPLVRKLQEKHPNQVHTVKSFLEAAKLIVKLVP